MAESSDQFGFCYAYQVTHEHVVKRYQACADIKFYRDSCRD